MDDGPVEQQEVTAVAETWWRAWLVPAVCTHRQMLIVALALVLPVLAVAAGWRAALFAMVLSTAVGGGLGLGWLVSCAPRWFVAAPLRTVMVLTCALGCLVWVWGMPRMEAALRLHAAAVSLRAWHDQARHGGGWRDPLPRPPEYDRGGGNTETMQLLIKPGAPLGPPTAIVAMTPTAVEVWSPWGWGGGRFLLLQADGTLVRVRTLDEIPATATLAPPP